MQRIAAVLLLTVSATSVAAGPFDGLYRPDEPWAAGWDCQSVGSDGGALAIRDDEFYGVESLCKLRNPTQVNGMDAMLFDAECNGEGMSYNYRLMLLRMPEGVAVIQDGSVSVLKRCN